MISGLQLLKMVGHVNTVSSEEATSLLSKLAGNRNPPAFSSQPAKPALSVPAQEPLPPVQLQVPFAGPVYPAAEPSTPSVVPVETSASSPQSAVPVVIQAPVQIQLPPTPATQEEREQLLTTVTMKPKPAPVVNPNVLTNQDFKKVEGLARGIFNSDYRKR